MADEPNNANNIKEDIIKETLQDFIKTLLDKFAVEKLSPQINRDSGAWQNFVSQLTDILTASLDQATANKNIVGVDPTSLAKLQGMALFMSKAYIASLYAGLHYYSRSVQIHANCYSNIGRSLTQMYLQPKSCAERSNILLDDMAACLREMANLPFQEARVLQAEIEKILRDMRETLGDAQKTDPIRRANAKD